MFGITVRLYSAFVLTIAVNINAAAECKLGNNCNLPDCFCKTESFPSMKTKNIPQFVYFGFDDAVTITVSRMYDYLFRQDMKNPDGCPVKMTLYVSDAYTDYDLVEKYYKRGHEIAVHSVTHRNVDTPEKLTYEADTQRQFLSDRSNIPRNEIVGWRSPNLFVSRKQAETLKGLNFKYDVSYTRLRTSLDNGPMVWPFTLNYGWPFDNCQIPPCPASRVSGFWILPVMSVVDYKSQWSCVYIDGCINDPRTKEDSFNFLWKNFQSYYKSKRAPFGVHMHASWFVGKQHHLEGMKEFIDRLLTLPDVYIVTATDVINWIQHPISAQNMTRSRCENPRKSMQNNGNDVTGQNVNPPTIVPPESNTKPTSGNNEKDGCHQGVNCKRPSCVCKTTKIPLSFQKNETPQMIYVTVDGNIHGAERRMLRRLFDQSITNPNGCTIKGTIFLTDLDSRYYYVKKLNRQGFEIALRGMKPEAFTNKDDMAKDITKQMNSTVSNAKIKLNDILGFRSPELHVLGDSQFDILSRRSLLYDSSLIASNKEAMNTWPFTLDFGWNEQCKNNNCPTKSHRGVWELPLVKFEENECIFLEECDMGIGKNNDIKTVLMTEFNKHYHGNRAPMGIALNGSWTGRKGKQNIRKLRSFLKTVSQHNDVYIVTIRDVIEWVKRPTKVDDLSKFGLWKCKD